MISTILVATDFSERARRATLFARNLALQTGAQIELLHVLRAPNMTLTGYPYFSSVATTEDVRRRLEQTAERDLTTRAERVGAAGVRVKTTMLRGNPVEQILDYAEDTRPDLVVMGTHGRRGIGRLILGSVAEDVVRRSQCPVVTISSNAPNSPDARVT